MRTKVKTGDRVIVYGYRDCSFAVDCVARVTASGQFYLRNTVGRFKSGGEHNEASRLADADMQSVKACPYSEELYGKLMQERRDHFAE